MLLVAVEVVGLGLAAAGKAQLRPAVAAVAEMAVAQRTPLHLIVYLFLLAQVTQYLLVVLS